MSRQAVEQTVVVGHNARAANTKVRVSKQRVAHVVVARRSPVLVTCTAASRSQVSRWWKQPNPAKSCGLVRRTYSEHLFGHRAIVLLVVRLEHCTVQHTAARAAVSEKKARV